MFFVSVFVVLQMRGSRTIHYLAGRVAGGARSVLGEEGDALRAGQLAAGSGGRGWGITAIGGADGGRVEGAHGSVALERAEVGPLHRQCRTTQGRRLRRLHLCVFVRMCGDWRAVELMALGRCRRGACQEEKGSVSSEAGEMRRGQAKGRKRHGMIPGRRQECRRKGRHRAPQAAAPSRRSPRP